LIRPIDLVMGAEVLGADLSRPARDADLQRFKDALHTHKVLVYRDQNLSKEQLIAFSRRWGLLGKHIMPGAASEDSGRPAITGPLRKRITTRPSENERAELSFRRHSSIVLAVVCARPDGLWQRFFVNQFLHYWCSGTRDQG
jgi:alpha-ketoglutarate-dependent taurine dioxygenase